ncbi:MAG: hypothetical protein ACXV39_01520 [Halobacteriota archaeon]
MAVLARSGDASYIIANGAANEIPIASRCAEVAKLLTKLFMTVSTEEG